MNATTLLGRVIETIPADMFQWAPTLGGECYEAKHGSIADFFTRAFQWAPTLGGECYIPTTPRAFASEALPRFDRHPPLGVNATRICRGARVLRPERAFQWAPTLGGECYKKNSRAVRLTPVGKRFNGHPPLGVNAIAQLTVGTPTRPTPVSMGTHPWG